MRPKKALMTLFAMTMTLAALITSGCGESPQFDPSTQYSAESLANELIFRSKTASDEGASRKQADAASRADPAKASKAREKSREETKAQDSPTLDQLIDQVAAKASLVPGKSRPEVLKAIVEIVGKDTTLKPSDKQAISEKLGKMATSP